MQAELVNNSDEKAQRGETYSASLQTKTFVVHLLKLVEAPNLEPGCRV